METVNLWKLVVDAGLEPEQIERAVAEVPDLVEPSSPIRGVELQRLDVVEGRSFVFVKGLEEGARALERCLKVHGKGAAVRCKTATAKELYANAPPKD